MTNSITLEKARTSILSFENETIAHAKEQQEFLFERMKGTQEISSHHFNNFMKDHSQEKELKALKSFELYAYDRFNFNMEVIKELDERLRVANELLKKNGIEIL